MGKKIKKRNELHKKTKQKRRTKKKPPETH
jgi:hypothetical protein